MTTVTSASPATAAAATEAAATKRGSLNQTFDSFLTLLTTQLRYQDPISPMDTNEFTSQLVQFSQVEQSIQQNENLETLIGLQGANQIAFAASLTGKDVEIEGNALTRAEGETLTYGYTLPTDAATTQINIMDAQGRIVLTKTGAVRAGEHSFAWDGMTRSGTPAPAGTYRIQVQAKDAAGEPITAETTVTVAVEGVELKDGQIALDVGAFTVSLSAVRAIRDRKDA